ncbi:MAG: hypothetical protein IPM98_20100 [Lewinellaceae bacterium]|nr:hypothetical protein [Lewinellaceae bacterium]
MLGNAEQMPSEIFPDFEGQHSLKASGYRREAVVKMPAFSTFLRRSPARRPPPFAGKAARRG